jgi:hypothetical protein
MGDFQIDLKGAAVPNTDGEINTYINKEAAANSTYFSTTKTVIFINGMKNSGEDHATSALALSLVQMCPVVGVYNKSSGLVPDLLQCLGDKNQFNGVSPTAAKQVARAQQTQVRQPDTVILQALSRNAAQLPLFNLLRKKENKGCEIFAHSQGNLILSNVLQGIAAVDGPQGVSGRIVHTFGSPAVNWPREITKFEHAFTFDPVTWLAGLDKTFSISKVGMPSGSLNPITHGFLKYLENDPAFVVNRFRVGGFGITFNMDEDGLAKCLAAMGTNIARVRRVFEHLNSKHNSDADDVAVRYVALVKNSPEITKAIALDKSFANLLITILGEGVVFADEKSAIQWLRGL